MYDGLAAAELPVVGLDGRHLKAATSAMPVKTDRSDRAVVLFGGRVVDILPADAADEATLTRAAYGLPRGAHDSVVEAVLAPAGQAQVS